MKILNIGSHREIFVDRLLNDRLLLRTDGFACGL